MLNKTQNKMLNRLHSGEYYPVYNSNGEAAGPVMRSLVEAGLVVEAVRFPVMRRYFMPIHAGVIYHEVSAPRFDPDSPHGNDTQRAAEIKQAFADVYHINQRLVSAIARLHSL